MYYSPNQNIQLTFSVESGVPVYSVSFKNQLVIEKSTLQISAHRGNASSAPENTLAAFKNALQAGTHVIEVDVRTTNDGVLMIMHDANLERTTNGKGAFKLYDAVFLKTLSAGKGFTGQN